MLDFIIFFIFISSFLFLIFDNAKVRSSLHRVSKKLLQTSIDNTILKDDISIKNSQEYLIFLNKSRDDAFLYIETVQESFLKFQKEMLPIVEHFERVGLAGSGYPLYDQMVTIVELYRELEKVFPEEIKND
jgi:hypothetical protein